MNDHIYIVSGDNNIMLSPHVLAESTSQGLLKLLSFKNLNLGPSWNSESYIMCPSEYTVLLKSQENRLAIP